MLLLDFQKLQREAEKRWIQYVVANIITFQSTINTKNTTAVTAERAVSMKENLNNNAEELTHTVKGKFGKQIRETIKNQANNFDQLE